MHAVHKTVLAALLLTLPVASMAADRIVHLNFADVVAEAQKNGNIDGSVKFYLAGNTPQGSVKVVKEHVSANRKTNAFGKKDAVSCAWVLQSVLTALQDEAKEAGANAVIDIVSNYDDVEYKDAENYECHAGFLMSGVQMKAKLAKIP
ncbi:MULTISPECIES: excinuclease [Dyella]|uniref:Excinuclease n=2 Tax=Dyella TaxID=231454 RepID=A0A4R0YTP2_9GAMM|nr:MULTISPECIES: excinuclease [Dyella]TBR39808.1 excinuclease [Dyella terrae]TCI12612.1 excinuclease [Dyella soli]